ncbi:DUF4870 domain-containing protein [Flavobacterium alvei]|uniref:DUF4870 domain-containing protein n=1 Tax=Flavobacterium alvei TaxID=2080416 RepID=A0A2S5A2Z4_9FLAO|nr:DUF4870 domain-containing protein [Flavobacterium alvei]POY36483.1 DUF4870 domain-containing protein [Flavobacterium alvei]HQE33825.1 DUF4870 domain-containing protein [Flavobacterium alvei]HQF47382.1 DUF4870 domain-containing protein [Flavobacterium alvei]HQK40426.1 DUF4870 domain-containing protein [Flavobacterium alvei]
METTNNKNLAAFTHLSTLTQYCIPFGNYIFPILIWSSNKSKSEFIDFNGKQVLNFQLSMFLYSLILAVIAIPILIITFFNNVPLHTLIDEEVFMRNHFSVENITGIAIVAIVAILLFVGLKVAEFFLIIYASVKASNGEKFEYPLTIPFLK